MFSLIAKPRTYYNYRIRNLIQPPYVQYRLLLSRGGSTIVPSAQELDLQSCGTKFAVIFRPLVPLKRSVIGSLALFAQLRPVINHANPTHLIIHVI